MLNCSHCSVLSLCSETNHTRCILCLKMIKTCKEREKKERFSSLFPLCVGDPRGYLGPECLGGVGRNQSSSGV